MEYRSSLPMQPSWPLLLATCLLLSCSPSRQRPSSKLQSVSVVWELIQNTSEEECQAEFRFVNHGKQALSGSNWCLYFNQTTVLPGPPMSDSLKGEVVHLNGDLYQFRPGPEFQISPGDSLRFRYQYKGAMIKERDRPDGAYFVEKNGSDEQVVLPNRFEALPLRNLEALFPDPELRALVSSPSNEYQRNLAISTLPLSAVGKITPSPYSIQEREGSIWLDPRTRIGYTEGLENEARQLQQGLQKITGRTFSMTKGTVTGPFSIQLQSSPITVNGISSEAYQLLAGPDSGIQVLGSDAPGVFYGIQSLLALVLADSSPGEWKIQSVEIQDAPRFAYRGFLLDIARNFQKKEAVLKLIDLLALYKINKLNLRMTEDEGWRLAIKGLPELTEVGGKRGHKGPTSNCLPPSYGSGPLPDDPGNHGSGYFSREDFKEILRYAHQHHIEVIPEVCFPSHARAAIQSMEARYQYYLAKKDTIKAQEFRLIDPEDASVYRSAQLYQDNIVCVALPSVYHFYETVVRDISQMYEEAGLKMTTFNTGGDEVPNGAWTQSPKCAELLKSLPHLSDYRQLQGYFLEKTLPILEKYQVQISGWEEIVLNKDSKGKAVVNTSFVGKPLLPLVWDNTDDNIDLGYRIANAGYPIVLCNVTNLYFDLAYSIDPTEPGLYWGGFQDAIDPYVMAPFDVFKTAHFDAFGRLGTNEQTFPGKERLRPENRPKIKGLQAQLWTETVKGPAMLEYYLAPKLFAFAEKAWSKAPAWEEENSLTQRNKAILEGWNELANRIGQREFTKLDAYFGSWNYRIPAPGAILEKGLFSANNAFPGLIIRYTSDGSEPGPASTPYLEPVPLNAGTIKVRAFNRAGRGGKSWTL